MSIHVLSWVLRHSPAEKSRRLVLIVLADKANDDGTGAYPSIETIRRETRLKSDSTVIDALGELEQTGQIRRCGKGPKGTTRWQIIMADAEAFYRRQGGSSDLLEQPGDDPAPLPQQGDSENRTPPETGPKPSLGTVQRELDLEDGSMDGSDPEIGPPALETWTRIRAALEASTPDFKWHIWLEPIEFVRIRGRRELVLFAPDHIRSSVQERYSPKITAAARDELGRHATVTFATEAPPRRLPAGREGDSNLEAA